MFGKRKISDVAFRRRRNERTNGKTTKAVLTAIVGVGLACRAAAQLKEQPGEVVKLRSLPASVQQTINQKAAGEEVVQVKREDDANGKWNYEVVVKTNGKGSGFELDPNGKLLRQHSEIKRPSLLDNGIALVPAFLDKRRTALRGDYKGDVFAALVPQNYSVGLAVRLPWLNVYLASRI